jgi:hypothetical protein
MIGRDVISPASADGKLGFSYTKIDVNGTSLPSAAAAWTCVRDNITGHTWEVKTTDNGPRDARLRYTIQEAAVYVANVNSIGLCGFTDWRLPTPAELLGIIDYGAVGTGQKVDGAFFPNTVLLPFSAYITGTLKANDVTFNWFPNFVWSVEFGNGTLGFYSTTSALLVMLVR